MFTKVLIAIILIGILVTLAGCGTAAAPAPTATPKSAVRPDVIRSIVLGKVSSKPAEKIQEYQPLADYLAANLGHFDIAVGEVRVAPDLATMANWMASGKVDIYFDNPYAALLVRDHAGGQPILIRVKEGEDNKHAVFFAKAERKISSLADLNGQMIALEEPDSASGFMLPLAHMLRVGLRPVEKVGPEAAVAADEVGYVFSLDDDNTVQWVFDSRVVAGVVDDEAFEEYSEENPGLLAPIAETEPILRHQLTVARPGLEPALLETIESLLTEVDETEARESVLGPSETVRFDDISASWATEVAHAEAMYKELIKD